MCRIVAKDLCIEARKLHRASAFVYTETDTIFFMNSEDVRILDNHVHVLHCSGLAQDRPCRTATREEVQI